MVYLFFFLAFTFGFMHSTCDNSLFIYKGGCYTFYSLLHVNDTILRAFSAFFLKSIIWMLCFEFSMKDLGPLSYFLGIFVT